ncbi:hypothetical protein LWI29_017174 [Acer saccharum]|uniref:Pentatricopeptide repeat-containing protein n=1 Tax=Acer saccharum TaxID=4024 RepID=A0AA39S7H4_ACESA|nr:hypothetical protein LWI29_017174 [Acer saccharum]
MTLNLNLGSPFLSGFAAPRFSKLHETNSSSSSTVLLTLLRPAATLFFNSRSLATTTRASLSEDENGVVEDPVSVSEILDEELLSSVSVAEDANEALEIISDSEKSKRSSGGVVSVNDCRLIINAAVGRGNTDLALSVFYAMRSSFDQGVSENSSFVDRWRWSRPDVNIYTSLVQGLAVSLKVSDALRLIDDICRVGVSPSEEVPFGKVVRCPTCLIAVAVAQPQHGIQIISCSKCRYKYELVSGGIVSIDSEEIRNSSYRTQHGYSCMEKGAKISANYEAKYSCRCSLYCGSDTFCLIPLLAVLATGDAVSRIVDPSLPQFLSVAAVASLAVGTTLNTVVFPQLSQLPQRLVEVIAIKQQLLSQYDVLQSRIKELKEVAEKEVWMLARMCQLENKIYAVGEPSYRARRSRLKRVREGLENSIRGRIELIDSYARISSMIEIEVEMDYDVLAAEEVSSTENVAEQIQQIMELENLEEKWRLQAEANDEAERLINSQAMPTEQV